MKVFISMLAAILIAAVIVVVIIAIYEFVGKDTSRDNGHNR